VAIEGTGIKSPSKKAQRMAMATYRVDPLDKLNRGIEENFRRLRNQESTGAVKETGRGMGDTFNPFADRADAKSNFFSPTDTKVAIGESGFTTESDTSFLDKDSDFNEFKKTYGGYYESFPGRIKKDIKLDYLDRNPTKYEQFLNKAPVQEKPTFVEQTKNLAGSIFNTVTGTQPAAASQIPGPIPSGSQFTSSNLDAARAPVGSVTTGDTSFSSFRMAGQPSVQEEKKNIVTPFSQTSMGRGEPVKVTPFSQTSMAVDKPTVTAPTVTNPKVSPSPTTPKTLAERQASKTYEQNRLKEGEKFADRGKREAVNASGFQQANVRGSAFNTGKDESKRPTVARQTVASLPSNYKETEAKAFAEAKAFKAKQAKAKAASEAKAKKAAESKRAAAAAAKAKAEGKTKAQQAAAARKAAGPNRTMSAGQQTRAQAGASARTAQGNRARVRSNARKRAQAAARKRRAKKKGKKK